MGIKLIKKEDGKERKISDSYSVFNLLTREDTENVSVAVSRAVDHQETIKTTSDRVYYVLEGELMVNDSLSAKQGDIIFVPSDTEYNFSGTFKAILINSPAFKKEND